MSVTFLSDLIKKEFGNIDFRVAPPEIKSHGHLSTNAAFALAKIKKISPMAAGELIRNLIVEKAGKEFSKIEVIAPGFVNFWFSPSAIQEQFKEIYKSKNKYGWSKIGAGKKVIVEYPSPNIGKPMHVGHMRSTIIGDAVANIYKFLGYKVIRWNYIGDWGTQFGKLIYAYKKWGDRNDLKKDPINTLLKLYIKFHNEAKRDEALGGMGQEEFKKLEDGDKENRKLWQLFTKESLKELNKIFKFLGIKFDVVLGESFYEERLKPLVAELARENIAVRSEGSLIINLDKFNLPPGLIEKSDGASLYLTREIANLEYRIKKYRPSKILYVVGNEQSLHFDQLFAIAKILGLDKCDLIHVKHGLVLGEDGKKLSTREGKIVVFEDLIKKSVELARLAVETKNPELSDKDKMVIAETVGIGALKYNDLSQNRTSNISFEWNKMLSFEGDSCPYIQYTYARLRSILRKAKPKKFDVKYLSKETDLELILKISELPSILERAAEEYLPNYIAHYLYDLAQTANRFYETEPILKSEQNLRSARLALIDSASLTIKTGLSLLGIEVLEQM